MRIFAIFLSLLLIGPANAMWMAFSDTDLIAKSDLIALGEIVEIKPIEAPKGQPPAYAAVIRLTEVLKGDGGSAEALLAMPSPEAPKSSEDISYRAGQKGLWFLRIHPQAPSAYRLYLADHPQRFVPMDQAARINAFRGLSRSVP